MAIHPAQRRVAPALQREVEVRTHFGHRRDPFDKRFCHDPWFKRAQADPLDTVDFPDPVHQIQQISP